MTHTELIKTAYATLNLEFGATEAQVKAAYKILSKKYHPDLAANKNDTEEQERLGHIQAELNYARDTLQEYFDLQKDKQEVSEKEQEKAIRLMYTNALKNEIDKTKLVINQAETSINRIIADFGHQSINNAAPLFNDAKELVAEQKEILDKCSAFATPLLINMQTKNIKQLNEHITSYSYLSKIANETLPEIIASVDYIAKASSNDNPTINMLSSVLNNEIKVIFDNVQKNGPTNINSKEVWDFLNIYYSFFRGAIRDITPIEIEHDNFYEDEYDYLRLISITNLSLPFTKCFPFNSEKQLATAGMDYLLENINVNALNSIVNNPNTNFANLQETYEEEFKKFIDCIKTQDLDWLSIRVYVKDKLPKYLNDSSRFFRLAKSHKEYYFLKDYKFENNRNTLEVLKSIKKYTYNLFRKYTTSIFSKQNNDNPSAIDDPIKFSESVSKFLADFKLSDDRNYSKIAYELRQIPNNLPTFAFIKNNFSGFYFEKQFKNRSCINSTELYAAIANLTFNVIKHEVKNADKAGNQNNPEDFSRFIDSVRDFSNKAEDFNKKNEPSYYFDNPSLCSNRNEFYTINSYLKLAEEMEKIMKLPHYNEIHKKIYDNFSLHNPYPNYKQIIASVTGNINKFYQKLLIKALFDSDKTLTKTDEHFLEFTKEFLANVYKDVAYFNSRKEHESAIYLLKTLENLKDSEIDINNANEVEKFVANKFNKSLYKYPEDIIELATTTYGETAAKKIALMLLKSYIKRDIKRSPDVHWLSLAAIKATKIPAEELIPIIEKYKNNLDTNIIKRINEYTGLNIQPAPPPPAPAMNMTR
ncbi:MAG: J domain-containing protein [Clostridiales bacterium]|jgi:hypothetical protein|nr:J domain-containing protein [Clostridiales bacterium]